MAKAKEEKKKTCFIVMPISTPESLQSQYGNDKDHFIHVMNHLFIPAIKEAKYEPIPPISKGSDVIHVDIIGHLEKANLVLVDMSILNANVFFEMGIRTALNKPTSLVFDGSGDYEVPFDTGLINYHSYDSRLDPWIIEKEIQKLAKHIQECEKKTPDYNALWNVFGMKVAAESSESTANLDTLALDLINLQLTGLRKSVDGILEREEPPTFDSKINYDPTRTITTPSISIRDALEFAGSKTENNLTKGIHLIMKGLDPNNTIVEYRVDDGDAKIVTDRELTNDAFLALKELTGKYRKNLIVDHLSF